MPRNGTRTLFIVGAVGLSLIAAAVTPLARRAHHLHPKTGQPIFLPGKDGDNTLLFNGWRISPVGRSIPTGDMLFGGALSPDGKTYAIASCGWNTNNVHLIDVETEKEVGNIALGRAWNGLAWSPNGGTLYIAGGVGNSTNDVYVFTKDEKGEWARQKGFKFPDHNAEKTVAAGLALTPDGKTLFALDNTSGVLYALDTADGKTLSRTPVGEHAIVCRLTLDGKTLYVANWGGSEVAVLDVSDTAKPTISARLKTGAHPNDLVLSSDDCLFVTCGNADAVSVYNTKTRRPLETVKTTLTTKAPSGSTPVALAVSPDNKTLYVANADNNDICVVDISTRGKSQVRGFLPTGWYPSAVAVSADGKKLLIGSGKGIGTHPNPTKVTPETVAPTGFEYIGHQLNGSLSFVDMPSSDQLAEYTKQVLANTPYNDSQLNQLAATKTAIPTKVGEKSPIKYILYIIKENRTYDQVFGDMSQGNGDPGMTLFGRDVSPNHHALAEQFVLLDNLYCNGEVSAEGIPGALPPSPPTSCSAPGCSPTPAKAARPGRTTSACRVKAISGTPANAKESPTARMGNMSTPLRASQRRNRESKEQLV